MPKGLGRLYPLVHLVIDRLHYDVKLTEVGKSTITTPGHSLGNLRLEQKPTERDSVEVQLSQGEISACCCKNNKRVWMHWRQREWSLLVLSLTQGNTAPLNWNNFSCVGEGEQ